MKMINNYEEKFNCLLNSLRKILSCGELEKILDLNIERFDGELFDGRSEVEIGETLHKKIKNLRKEAQIKGIICLIKNLGPYENILDIGCGVGLLSREIAVQFPSTKVLCIERNPKIVEKAVFITQEYENLSFRQDDAFSYSSEFEKGLVLTLHGCGSLSDRVIEIAANSNSDVICVPCCYPKAELNYPISEIMKKRQKEFEVIKKRLFSLEGINDGDNGRKKVLRDVYRVLFNYDKVFYLVERGYSPGIVEITPKKVKTEKGKYLCSSHRIAIVGTKT